MLKSSEHAAKIAHGRPAQQYDKKQQWQQRHVALAHTLIDYQLQIQG